MSKCVSMTIFAKNVNAAREKNGMTIQDLAALVGIERSYLSRIIHGHHSPSLDLMEKIANACGEPLYELLNPNSEKMLSKTA
jgi:transcriptional regulator with XRE-family HTH domain